MLKFAEPVPETPAIAEMIERVVAGGTSRHSAAAKTLPLVINALEQRRIPYVLEAVPGAGYQITGRPDLKTA